MKQTKQSNRKVEPKKKITLDELKSAAKSVKTEEALSKIVGGILSKCHLVSA